MSKTPEITGADLKVFCWLVKRFDKKYPKRAASSEVTNAIIEKIIELEQLYAAAPEVVSRESATERILNQKIADIGGRGLSARAWNVLTTPPMSYEPELVFLSDLNEHVLLERRNCGEVTTAEIMAWKHRLVEDSA